MALFSLDLAQLRRRKKTIRQKTKVKAKSKATPKKNFKPRPQVQASVALADKVAVRPEKAQWFLRVDYGATNHVRGNDDSHCPIWSDVKRRRTLNIRNGELIMEDHILHLRLEDDVIGSGAGGITREVIDGLTGIRQCARRSGAIDGGITRGVATFLYRDVVVSGHDCATEKRALSFFSPVGARLYRSTFGAVRRALHFFRTGIID